MDRCNGQEAACGVGHNWEEHHDGGDCNLGEDICCTKPRIEDRRECNNGRTTHNSYEHKDGFCKVLKQTHNERRNNRNASPPR